MNAGSLVGFALAIVVVAWLIAGVLGGSHLLIRRWAARRGPATERSIALFALLVPPLVALAVVTPVAVGSVLAAGAAAADHCGAHDHHAHLCVVHGAGWIDQPAAVATLALVGGLAVVGVARLLWSAVGMRRLVRRLAATATTHDGVDDVRVVPTTRAFAFVAGFWRPRVYVGAGLWDRLAPASREALLAHERAHVAQRDPAWSVVVSVLAAWAPPGLGAAWQRRWHDATERLCDSRAAAATSVEAVANALVIAVRANRDDPRALGVTMGFMPRRGLDARVEALLARDPAVTAPAPALRLGGVALVIASAVVAASFIDPTHHALESLLGVF